MKVLLQCKPLAAKGSTGWTTDLLLLLHDHAAEAILAIIKRIIIGDVSPVLQAYLPGGNLFLIAKSSGTLPRPVVPQSALQKIAERLVLPSKRDICSALLPFQFGVGFSRATTTVANLTRALLQADPTDHVACVDLSNAFGTIDRAAILDALRASDTFSHLAPFFKRAYARPVEISSFNAEGQLGYVSVDTDSPRLGAFTSLLRHRHP